MNPGERQRHEQRRLKNAELWADFVRDRSNPEWSQLQADLINSQLDNALRIGLTAQQVKQVKDIKSSPTANRPGECKKSPSIGISI